MRFWSSIGSAFTTLSEELGRKEVKNKPEDAGFKNFARDVEMLKNFDINGDGRAEEKKRNIAKE